MFFFTKGLLPNAFGNMFQFVSQRHPYNTRNSRNFYIFPCRTINIRQFSMRFRGPNSFNSLSPEIQNADSVGLFKKKLKDYLFL